MPSFAPPLPTPISYGFTAGVLRVLWTREPPIEISGRAGLMFMARLAECHTRTETLGRDLVNAGLTGLVVRAPNGTLSRIASVESYATTNLGGTGHGETLGVLLVPIDEI